MLFKTLSISLALVYAVTAAPTSLNKKAGVQVIDNCYNSGQVALTFDDGPYEYENQIADRFNGGKGTFFLNGNNYVCIYDRIDQVRALHAAGHTLASHTWSHANLATLDYNGINQELEKLETAFIRILGLKPLYFRPPYGSYNDLVLQVLGDRGYKKLFLWSEDTGDANGDSVQSSRNVIDKVVNDYPQPHNILAHSVVDTTPTQVVPYAIDRLQGAGYQLVSVDTCLGGAGEWPYEYVGQPGTPDGSWRC